MGKHGLQQRDRGELKLNHGLYFGFDHRIFFKTLPFHTMNVHAYARF